MSSSHSKRSRTRQIVSFRKRKKNFKYELDSLNKLNGVLNTCKRKDTKRIMRKTQIAMSNCVLCFIYMRINVMYRFYFMNKYCSMKLTLNIKEICVIFSTIFSLNQVKKNPIKTIKYST